jgi:hypothetical protein
MTKYFKICKKKKKTGYVTGDALKINIYVIYTDINEQLRFYYFVHAKLLYTARQNMTRLSYT